MNSMQISILRINEKFHSNVAYSIAVILRNNNIHNNNNNNV